MTSLLRNKWIILLGMLLLAVLTWSSLLFGAAPASAQKEPERVAIGSDLVIAEGEVVQGDVSVTNGNLVLKGEVKGDAAVVNGDADIEGKVGGDVAVTSGRVVLGSHSSVAGNVLAFMGRVERSPGAVVSGTVTGLQNPLENAFGKVSPGFQRTGPPSFITNSIGRFAGFFSWGMLSLLLLFLAVLIAAVLPGRIRVSGDTLETEVGVSVIVGTILSVLLVPVTGIICIALVVTVVGVVLVPVVLAAVVIGLLFGLVAVSVWLGRHIHASTRTHNTPPVQAPLLVEVLLGMSIVLVSTLVPAALLPGWVAFLMLPLLYFTACVGLGAAILSRMGTLVPPSKATPLPAHDIVAPSQEAR